MSKSASSEDIVVGSRSAGVVDGQIVREWSLANRAAMEVKVLDFGGTITSITVPDRHGSTANVVLGFSALDDYVARRSMFGCITGRFANRIADGRFTLDGTAYQLPTNSGRHSLHGGHNGFDRFVWHSEAVRHETSAGVKLSRTSPHGEEAYPGELSVSVTYRLTTTNDLIVDYTAETDAPTIVNLTNHAFFNLAGEGSGDIYDHELMLRASQYLPTDADGIPLGELTAVQSSPFDFTFSKPVGRDIRLQHDQLQIGLGYDHTFVIDRPRQHHAALLQAAVLRHPASGRTLTLSTTEPGIQVYSGNKLDGSLVGASGRAYRQGDGIALEPQHFPNSPNQPAFPPTVLRPGERFQSTTVLSFSVS